MKIPKLKRFVDQIKPYQITATDLDDIIEYAEKNRELIAVQFWIFVAFLFLIIGVILHD